MRRTHKLDLLLRLQLHVIDLLLANSVHRQLNGVLTGLAKPEFHAVLVSHVGHVVFLWSMRSYYFIKAFIEKFLPRLNFDIPLDYFSNKSLIKLLFLSLEGLPLLSHRYNNLRLFV